MTTTLLTITHGHVKAGETVVEVGQPLGALLLAASFTEIFVWEQAEALKREAVEAQNHPHGLIAEGKAILGALHLWQTALTVYS
jgi:hypothetical protein